MMDTGHGDVLIVGGGHAAAQIVPALRRFGWQGGITLISDEPVLPYHRPPLSKDYLKGVRTRDQLLIRRDTVYEQAQARVFLGRRVEAIDRAAQTVTLEDGERLTYAHLVLATGSVPRRLPVPGADLSGVFYVRTLADIDGLKAVFAAGLRTVVIGGGYVGLEAAAALRGLGAEVTVLEALARVLQRVTCPAVSAFFTRVHEEEGVRVLTDARVAALAGDERVTGVRLADGAVLPADLVIVGIGILPATALAEAAGLAVDDGIVVDAFARTSDPRILAAGDCARFEHPLYGRTVRLESVQNANDQGTTAARTIAGDPVPYDAVPWFWSDQYDVKLQIAGLSQGYDRVVLRGDPSIGRSFSAVYLDGDRLLAVDAVNQAKDFLAAKKLVAAGARIDSSRAADPALPLAEAVSC